MIDLTSNCLISQLHTRYDKGPAVQCNHLPMNRGGVGGEASSDEEEEEEDNGGESATEPLPAPFPRS